MKYFVVISFIAGLFAAQTAVADCIRNRYGDVVCGRGQCEMDNYGKFSVPMSGVVQLRINTGKSSAGLDIVRRIIREWFGAPKRQAAALPSIRTGR